MIAPILILSAIIIGLGVGMFFQKGRACTNSAFRNLFLFGNSELSTMIPVIIGVELVGYYLLSVVTIPGFQFVSNPIPFSWLFIPFGGFIFGLGTVLAGGCAGGVCYRVGEGKLTAVLALIGFATGIALIYTGPLSPLVNEGWKSTTVTIDNTTPSLEVLLPRWFWTLLGMLFAITVALRYYLRKNRGELELKHLLPFWTPVVVGVGIGILGVAARYTSTLSGRPFGLSTTDGIAQLVLLLVAFDPPGWAGIFIAALIVGSAIASLSGREFSIRLPRSKEFLRYFGGGILLGSGAMLGYGCNIGHIFGGIPELGISSLISVVFMIAGNYSGSYLYYLRFGHLLPESTPLSIQ